MSGFASLRISAAQQTARSRFSFLFRIPGQGRIEVFDPLGRIHYQILIVNQQSHFVVPSKKVYWQGGETEILEKFLGFPLHLDEIVALMSGRWPDEGPENTTEWMLGWIIERDRRGRIQAGRRGDFDFQVDGYFDASPWVQSVVFRHPQTEGRVKILDVHFDRPIAEELFSTALLERFVRMTWEEIEKILDAEI